jgi:hypothetical protein
MIPYQLRSALKRMNSLPPHLAEEATPFLMSKTLRSAAESLYVLGVPAATPPMTT